MVHRSTQNLKKKTCAKNLEMPQAQTYDAQATSCVLRVFSYVSSLLCTVVENEIEVSA